LLACGLLKGFSERSRMQPKILIVDDDLWIQREVLAALDGQGYQLMAASNGVTALACAVAAPPDVILSDVVMPVMDGWSLLRRVRQHPRLMGVPFVLMTGQAEVEDLKRGFRLGADDYVPKPFEAQDLRDRVDHLLYRTTASSGAYVRPSEVGVVSDAFGFAGALADLSLTALLSFLDMERKSGMLVVRRDGERGRVFVREGRVVGARIDRGPVLLGAEAVYWMLRWSGGKFEFRALSVDMSDEVQCPTAYLVLEGARRLDEARANAAEAL
jgi:CheY-like chemotaxis protein